MPYNKRDGRSYFFGITSYPSNPHKWEEIPSGALESLGQTCGIEGLHQVFVIPWAVRSVDFTGRKIITPDSVLALGTRAVGLWTAKPEPGIKAAIPVAELAAIEDIAVLLYGRLSFLSRDGRVTIRYNTVARRALEPALLELRKRLSGPAQPIPREEERWASLPLKWINIVKSSLARLQEDASVAFRFAEAPRKSRRDEKRAHMLVLNPRELVYIRDPFDSRYGSDSFIVPRGTISDVRVVEERLSITSNNALFQLPMLPEFRDAAANWLRP
jgi:hypothetical protein